jgi:hypothetical protein
MARRVWPLCLFLAHTCAARHTGYALRGTRGFSGLEMLVTGWMGVLQLDPLHSSRSLQHGYAPARRTGAKKPALLPMAGR